MVYCGIYPAEGEEHAGRRLTRPHPLLGERDYVLVPMEDLMHDPVRFLTHSGDRPSRNINPDWGE